MNEEKKNNPINGEPEEITSEGIQTENSSLEGKEVQVESPQVENAQVENPQVENAQVESAQVENKQVEEPKTETFQQEAPREDPPQVEPRVYRFEEQVEPQEQPKKKSKVPIAIIVAAAAVGLIVGLGVIGAGGLVKLYTDNKFDTSFSDPLKTNETKSISEVSTVSGSAAGAQDVSELVEEVMPSIVSITETKYVSSYFGQSYPSTGAGSGIIIKQEDKNLLIATNNHVIEGADKITVKFVDDTTATAKVRGTDEDADLAVISVKLSDLGEKTLKDIKVAQLGDSDDVKVGQMAIAIGNAMGYGQSVTVGYISAKDREITVGDSDEDAKTMVVLQTDAAINPGNSGGALLDAQGRVIGINSVKYASTSVEGIGYAIPISQAIPIINKLMDQEVIEDEEKGYLGITGKTVSESVSQAYGFPKGVYVYEMESNSAAAKAGIQVGDVITKVEGKSITSLKELQSAITSHKAGSTITVTVSRRDGNDYKEKDIKATLGVYPTESGYGSQNRGKDSQEDDMDEGYYDDDDADQIVPW